MTWINQVHFGDCRDSMRKLIAAGVRVNCIVTSPPYWGLRDYQVPPSIWGDFGECAEHDWADEKVERELRRGLGMAALGEKYRGGGHKAGEIPHVSFTHGTCVKCGAWRGCLGLEPTPEMYVAHLVEVFSLARELLADDGTLWLNLGDSYNSTGSGSAGNHSTLQGGKENQKEAAKRPAKLVEGLKTKDLVGIPWRVAFALQADGWYLRQDIIWSKPNPMPESVRDRCTKAHEYIFMLTKSPKYYYDAAAIAEPLASASVDRLSPANLANQAGSSRVPGKTNGKMKAVFKQDGVGKRQYSGFNARYFGSDKPYEGQATKDFEAGGAQNASDVKRRIVDRILAGEIVTRNKRSVWTVTTKPFKAAHFATFPPDLIEPCIMAGTQPAGVVMDPFMGSGTTAEVAQRLGRQWVGCELNESYAPLQKKRTEQLGLPV